MNIKKFLSLLIVFFAFPSFAALPDIVALVNDQPITKYDFEARKKLIVGLNNIQISNALMEAKLNSDILNILIDEELLNQHTKKIGGSIDKEDIDNAIATLEERNKMPKNGLSNYLKERGLSMNSFRQQIKGELIKTNIINSLSRSVSVSQTEIDTALVNNTDLDFNVEAWVFTSKEGTDNSLKQMQLLKKRLVSCNKLDDKLYASFADAEKFDRKLKDLPNRTQSIVLDTKVSSSSTIYKEDDKFKLVFVCKKDRNVSEDNLNKFETFLSNKKMSKKARKFFNDLKAKAYIKTMIQG